MRFFSNPKTPICVEQATDVLCGDQWYPSRITGVTKTAVHIRYGLDPANTAGGQRGTVETECIATDLKPRAETHSRVSTDLPTQEYPAHPHPDIEAYRTTKNTATRATNRARAKRTAIARAILFFALPLGNFNTQAMARGGRMDGKPYILEVFSGPFRSMAYAYQRAHDGGSVTVDIDPAFKPDLEEDITQWNPWLWMLGCHALSHRRSASIDIPSAIHFSPPCITFGIAGAKFHGRGIHYPAGFSDDMQAWMANLCALVICLMIDQIQQIATSSYIHFIMYIIENPYDSMMWHLPCMAQLIARSCSLTVCYCMYGSGAPKRTMFILSAAVKDHLIWATACEGPALYNFKVCCDNSGSCGAILSTARSPTPTHNYKSGGFNISDAEIPLLLAALLHQAWIRVSGKRRKQTQGASGQAERADIARLAIEWQAVVNSISRTPPAQPTWPPAPETPAPTAMEEDGEGSAGRHPSPPTRNEEGDYAMISPLTSEADTDEEGS